MQGREHTLGAAIGVNNLSGCWAQRSVQRVEGQNVFFFFNGKPKEYEFFLVSLLFCWWWLFFGVRDQWLVVLLVFEWVSRSLLLAFLVLLYLDSRLDFF